MRNQFIFYAIMIVMYQSYLAPCHKAKRSNMYVDVVSNYGSDKTMVLMRRS